MHVHTQLRSIKELRTLIPHICSYKVLLSLHLFLHNRNVHSRCGTHSLKKMECWSVPKNLKWKSGVCLTLGGVGKFVLTTQTWATPQEHASLSTDVITTTSAILKEKMKRETHGCEPWGQAQELCQCSVLLQNSSSLTPLQKALVWKCERAA